MKKLVIVTTVPQTLAQILVGQPKALSSEFDVTLVSSSECELKLVAEKEQISKYHSIEMNRGISPFQDFKSIIKMYKLLIVLQPDIIHSYTPKAGLVCSVAGFMARTPIRIHTFTGLIFPYCKGVKRFLLKKIDALICFLNTNVVPEGEGVKFDLSAITSKRLEVIGNGNIAGVDTKFFDKNNPLINSFNINKATNVNKESFIFCFIGRLHPDKGIRELLYAFIEASKQVSISLDLVVVGGVDDTTPLGLKLQNIIESNPNIHWVGEVEDIRSYLNACNVHILPSYREGFPNVVLQAGSMGCPSIVTNVSGSNEVINHLDNGWVVEPHNIEQLCEAMLESAKANDIHEMGIRARHNVVRKFDRTYYLKCLFSFYRGL